MNCIGLRHIAWLAVGLATLLVTPAGATTVESGDNVRISPVHEIDDDFYAFAEKMQVEGKIAGDFTGFGGEAIVKGNIGGSGNFICRYADHNGSLEGSLRFLGERLTVTGRVGGSILGAGASIMVRQGSIIEKDVNVAAGEIDLDGTILGRVECAGGKVRITAQIGGDLEVEADEIVIAPPAVIRGNFTYRTPSEDQLTLEPGVTIIGTTTWLEPEETEDNGGLPAVAYAIANLAAAFIFGILVLKLFRAYAQEALSQLRRRVTVSIAAGLLGLVGLVVAMMVLVLALIGTGIGTLLLSGELAFLGVCLLVVSILAVPITSFITVTGAIILYSGKIVVGLVLGGLVLGLFRSDGSETGKLDLLVGLSLLTAATALPYVGLVVYFLTMLIGAGAIVLGIYRCRHAN